MSPQISAEIQAAIQAEQEAGRQKYGKDANNFAHDDCTPDAAWHGYIADHNERAKESTPMERRQHLLKVAGLAISAVEAFDRKSGKVKHQEPGSAFVVESQRVQWWLGKLDRYDNVKELTDGAHPEAAGAHEAMYLFNRLGLVDKETKYAVVRCEVFEPIPDSSRANQDALKTLNGIGLGQNSQDQESPR